jgi:hypothetical protein
MPLDLSDVEKKRWIEHRSCNSGYRARGIGSKTSPERKKQIVSLYQEYPSITYVAKKMRIDRKIIRTVLEGKGLL